MDGDDQVIPIFLLVGPSQVGKDSLIRVLVRQHGWHAPVNLTTRAPRDGEVDGTDYTFVDISTFHRLISTGAFVDWDYTAGNYYGIPVRSGPPAPAPEVMHCLSRMAIRLDGRAGRYAPVLLLPRSVEAHRERITRTFRSQRAVLQRMAMFDEELAHAPLFQRVIQVEDFASSREVVDEFLTYARELM